MDVSGSPPAAPGSDPRQDTWAPAVSPRFGGDAGYGLAPILLTLLVLFDFLLVSVNPSSLYGGKKIHACT